ncbi:MAG: glutamate synthase subunit alpha, partial [Kamptonema sp. SIO4C4]|nr:glutamate synthase subunit alpha [Kamptonema sp. SIO4C4]
SMTLAGRSLPHAVMMMIPEPWYNHESMNAEQRAFYEYHSCLMEPWDGPASIAFTDGTGIGAVLDRNGLRPSRYTVTKDGLVIMASEAGVLPIEPERVEKKGRLEPGRMFYVNIDEGRIIADEEIKQGIATEKPYQAWLDQHLVQLEDLSPVTSHQSFQSPVTSQEESKQTTNNKQPTTNNQQQTTNNKNLIQQQKAFGYTFEELRILLTPMAQNGVEALGAMGTDTPLSVLSNRPKLLYDYFQQLFAQVTNPPIDSIREAIITSPITTIGSEGNLLDPQPESCHLIQLKTPILKNEELAKLKAGQEKGFPSETLPILFDPKSGVNGLEAALENICAQADQAIEAGTSLLILSDRGVDENNAPIPALLAVAGLHHHLIRAGTRTRVGIVLESGEPREVHHFAVLIGYGCGAINPYLAFETIGDLIEQKQVNNLDYATACKNYIKAVTKGVIKIGSKIGVSTIQSYRGAQIFEAIGLHTSVVDKYFTWTASRIEGADLEALTQEALMRYQKGFTNEPNPTIDTRPLHQGLG